MSYQVLARKWRPHNFQQVVGQQHVLTALANGLSQNKVHHAYLLSGTRGVGKTTIARILAKSLNCAQGVTATPCDQCEHCQAIDQGRFVDLLEVDAASRTKVDDTRELLDNVQYKPAQGRYKVYLIDEVHMLSKHSFNALLKTLEEPPEYVKFILATTDPQKLPITVLSRCLQFHLKAILPQQIEQQLALILHHEQATFEHAALAVIAKAADGSMRDALSLTDQALAFGAGNIEYQSVLKMLGTIDQSHLLYLLHFIASGNIEKVFQKIEELVHLGADFAMLHQELASLCHQIALQQIRNSTSAQEKDALQLLAERLTPEEVQLYYQIAVQGYKDYAFAPNGKIALEMTVMRLLAFKPANYINLDEQQLTTAAIQEKQPNETVAPINQPIQSEKVNTISETVIPETATTEIAAVDRPLAKPHSALPEVAESISPVSVQPTSAQEQSIPVQEKQPVGADAVVHEEQVKIATVAPIKEMTHSINMLRSHRLKREEAKKSQATTVNNDLVVAAPNVEQIATPVAVKAEQDVAAEQEILDSSLLPLDAYQQDDMPPMEDNSQQLEEFPEPEDSPELLVATINQQVQHSNQTLQSSAVNTQQSAISVPAETVEESTSDSMFVNEQLQSAEIDIAKYVDDKLTDPWSVAIQKMQLTGLVKLLAKNTVMTKDAEQLVLVLKSEQQHLLNNPKLCEQLEVKLKAHFGAQISLYIKVGNVTGKLTPVESELQIFQQYLDSAKREIKEDKNILTFVRDYGAKIYENSIIPL